MSLHGLALLGNNNSPIYMCSSNVNNNNNNSNSNSNSNINDITKDTENKDNNALPSSSSSSLPLPLMKEDLFGFFEDNNNNDDNQQQIIDGEKSPGSGVKRPSNVSMRQEMMFHAAIDRIEEILGSPRKTNYKRFQRGSHWIGKICPMEEFEIYGYVTSSDVKILALIERGEIIPLKKRKEVDIKILFTAIHDCYVKHTLNPFSKIKGKIEPPCTEFDTSIQVAMDQYNYAVNGN